jgi:predicted lipoprotein with Yx(FWY)xxD motif
MIYYIKNKKYGGFKMRKIQVYTFGGKPEIEFERGGILYEFDNDSFTIEEYESERAMRLYQAIDADPDDLEYKLIRTSDENDRWALVGNTITGHLFAVEE